MSAVHLDQFIINVLAVASCLNHCVHLGHKF